MFLEGARWDDQDDHQLTDSKPKELFSNLPLMHLNPVADREIPSSGIYKCPLYIKHGDFNDEKQTYKEKM